MQILYLKSSMDRFIVYLADFLRQLCSYLKSSMDRFIVYSGSGKDNLENNLKSSMDRFIEVKSSEVLADVVVFKIQYG